MKIIHYTLRRDRTPNSANCRRHRFDRSWESDKCTERGGEGKVGIRSRIFYLLLVFFFVGGGGVFVDGGKLKRVETVNKGIKYTLEI